MVTTASARAPFTVSAELLYQVIGYRWAQNLAKYSAAEVTRFTKLYETVPNLRARVAGKDLEVK